MNYTFNSVNLEELIEKLDKESFYMYRFKTEMCPNISIKHNYKDCLYFHSPKDYRRKPDFIRYYPENCSNGTNCPNNPDWDMSHSFFENLYHPLKYKVNYWDKIVHSAENSILYWIRGDRCAFYHDESDRRKIAANGWKVNWVQDDNRSALSGLSSQGVLSSIEGSRFIPFSPHEDIGSDVGVYQRKHARSEFLPHQMPSLSQPVPIGISNSNINNLPHHHTSYAMHHNAMTSNPYMIPPQYNMNQKISSPKKVYNVGFDFKEQSEFINNKPEVIYNNQLFEGNVIPSRQTSYSEHSAYMLKSQYPGFSRMMENKIISKPYKIQQTQSPGFESHGVDSTNPSSEINNKKRASKPESDHLKYLFEGGLGYERRADSLKYSAAPGLSSKYKMEEESDHVKSQNDYSEQYHEKLESRFIMTTQRKITEDKEKEDSSQNSSEDERSK